MRWTRDWRIYLIAATLFVVAGTLAMINDGPGFRPVFAFIMATGMLLIGFKAKRESGTSPPA